MLVPFVYATSQRVWPAAVMAHPMHELKPVPTPVTTAPELEMVPAPAVLPPVIESAPAPPAAVGTVVRSGSRP